MAEVDSGVIDNEDRLSHVTEDNIVTSKERVALENVCYLLLVILRLAHFNFSNDVRMNLLV